MCSQLESRAPAPEQEHIAPTHVMVNAGVGGFAAAICGHLWEELGEDRPRFVCVEPKAAPALLKAGEGGGGIVKVPCEDTMQTGLACGEAAHLAWDVLRTGSDDFVAIGDECVAPAMGLLAAGDPATNTPPIVAGASAVAGLGVLLASAKDAALRESLGLTVSSRVAFVVCETAVEPSLYEDLVGVSAEDLIKHAGAVV
jgi:diaminopropionate ammonia-lyase